MRGGLLAVGSLMLVTALGAQGGTDIWVAELRGSGSGLSLGELRNVTRRVGYDNQPQFTPDGTVLLYTRIEADGRSDVWRVTWAEGITRRLTQTVVEQEYSPTPMPDGSGFSAIVVEADSTQRLWAYGWDGVPQRVIVPALKPVGYHVWVGTGSIGAFVLSQPTPRDANALVLMHPQTERVDTITRGIGRAFAPVPGREAFSFVHFHGDTAVLGEVDVRTREVRRIVGLPREAEYHVWLPDGSALISGNGVLYRWAEGRMETFVDLRARGVQDASRLALSADGRTLAIVGADAR
jgi:hypothetical protein